jgi:hypothetical protein
MTQLFGTQGTTYDSDLGEFVSDSHVHLAAVIHDFNPDMSLVYIPKKDQTGFEKPWAIVERSLHFGEHIIRYLDNEEMKNPAAVLAWLFEGSQRHNDTRDILARIEREATAQKLLDLKRQEEELEDMADHMQFYLTGGRDKLHTIRHGGGVTVERG